MRSESTRALGQPRLTQPTLGLDMEEPLALPLRQKEKAKGAHSSGRTAAPPAQSRLSRVQVRRSNKSHLRAKKAGRFEDEGPAITEVMERSKSRTDTSTLHRTGADPAGSHRGSSQPRQSRYRSSRWCHRRIRS